MTDKLYVPMKKTIIIVIALQLLLSGCNSKDIRLKGEEQIGKYTKFWNSKVLFSNSSKGVIEQRDLKGNLIAKLGKGKICAVSEKWLYFQREEKEKVTTVFSVWKLRIDNVVEEQLLDIQSAEKIFEGRGDYCNIYIKEPYLAMVLDHGYGENAELCIYDMEKKRVLPCDIQTAVGTNEYYMIETICFVDNLIFISVSGEGIFLKNLQEAKRQAEAIYNGYYSCNSIAFQKDTLYFEDGECEDPPQQPYSLKSVNLKERIVLREIESVDVEELMKKQLRMEYGNQVDKIQYEGGFDEFYMDQGQAYTFVDKITFKLDGNRRECFAFICYDPQKGISSLAYEEEVTEFLKGDKNRRIFDVCQGKVLIKQNKLAYEFDLKTKKHRKLKKSDLNYWYIFGRLK